ncbi:MAG: hypothetical protein HKP37_04365 [Boseongicola sp.]|nr:hypothetical protein [Boseongicola sp.]
MPDFDFDAKVDELIASDWTGVTITHPYKIAARTRAGDGMIAEAAHLAASNLLTFRPKTKGFNTDYTGFVGAWKATMGDALPGKVAVAGAGGVAGAIVPALVVLGASDITLWDPVPEAAEKMAELVGGPARAIGMDESGDATRDADGLVNASALGMGDDRRSAFDTAAIGEQSWAFDAVYTPTQTTFLKAAASQGLLAISGFDLFRHMILGSFEAYSGIRPDPVAMLPLIDALRPD